MMADMGGGPVAGDLLGGRPGLGLSGLAPTPPAEEVYDPKNGDPERQKEFAAWKKAGGAQFVPPRAPGAIAETDLEERALERALEQASMLRFGNTLEQSSRLAAGMPMGGDELRGRRESESAPMGEFAARMGVRMDRSKMMASLQEKLRQNGREDLADKLKQAEFGLKQKESAWKMGRPDLDERRLAETERHNREAEAKDTFFEVNALFKQVAREHKYFGLDEKTLWKKIENNRKAVRGIPEKFFIDREGRLVRKFIGPVTAEKLRAILDELLIQRG